MNAEIAMVENETIERGLVAVNGMMYRMRHKRDCLAAAAMGPTVLLSSSPIMSPMFLIVASILDMKRAMQNSPCGSNGNGERFGLLFKEAFAKPNGGEVEREIEVEQ